MRKTWQAYGGDIALWALAVIAVAGVVVGSTVTRIALTAVLAICAPLLATLRRRDVLARRRDAELSAERAAAEERSAAEARLKALSGVQDDLAGEVNSTIVEIVAAQQAVVRAAHPDDILLRLTAAEDQAHSTLRSLAAITGGGEAGMASQQV